MDKLKRVTLWYRVALITGCSYAWTIIVNDEDEEREAAYSVNFEKWITDRIEYSVNI